MQTTQQHAGDYDEQCDLISCGTIWPRRLVENSNFNFQIIPAQAVRIILVVMESVVGGVAQLSSREL